MLVRLLVKKFIILEIQFRFACGESYLYLNVELFYYVISAT